MSPTLEQLVQRAWQALWREGSPYYLPTAFQHGRLSGHIRIRPLATLPIPDVSDVVLLDRAPWGGVTMSLQGSRLEGLSSIAGVDCEFDPASGHVTAGIRFSGLRCAGGHLVRAGHRTGAAVATAMSALQSDSGGNDSNLTLAKSYESQPIDAERQRPRDGRHLLPEQRHTLNSFRRCRTSCRCGRSTRRQVRRRSSTRSDEQRCATRNTGTVAVNGQPDGQGYSPYNAHSFFMQNFVMATCYGAASHYGTATEKGKRYTKAGDDAQQFGVPAKPPSKQPQTVNAVLAAVAASTSPNKADLKMVMEDDDPQWLKDVRTKAQSMAKNVIQKDLVEGGINTAALARPIRGGYSGAVPDVIFTLTGSIKPKGPGGAPQITFTKLEGPGVDVEIALSDLPADLGGEVGTALARARFLKRLLGHRAASALASCTMLKYLSRQMNLALAQRLGATGERPPS